MGRIIIILINLYIIYLGFGWGAAVGSGWTSNAYDDWADQKIAEYTHEVTIYWDENMTSYTIIEVREDMNWTISGTYGYTSSVYSMSNPTSRDDTGISYMLNGRVPEGKTIEDFAGLWNTAYGGTQYVNSAGYSLYTIKGDMALFALWN